MIWNWRLCRHIHEFEREHQSDDIL